MATTPAPKTVIVDGKYTKFEPSPDQQTFLDTYGLQDGKDCERMREAVDMASALCISWRKAFFKILDAE